LVYTFENNSLTALEPMSTEAYISDIWVKHLFKIDRMFHL
jgi:hypothetical protein